MGTLLEACNAGLGASAKISLDRYVRAKCLLSEVPHSALVVVELPLGRLVRTQTDLNGCARRSVYDSIAYQMKHNILKLEWNAPSRIVSFDKSFSSLGKNLPSTSSLIALDR